MRRGAKGNYLPSAERPSRPSMEAKPSILDMKYGRIRKFVASWQVAGEANRKEFLFDINQRGERKF